MKVNRPIGQKTKVVLPPRGRLRCELSPHQTQCLVCREKTEAETRLFANAEIPEGTVTIRIL